MLADTRDFRLPASTLTSKRPGEDKTALVDQGKRRSFEISRVGAESG